jgi:hypothetical protein
LEAISVAIVEGTEHTFQQGSNHSKGDDSVLLPKLDRLLLRHRLGLIFEQSLDKLIQILVHLLKVSIILRD